jgi:hypothetical protein
VPHIVSGPAAVLAAPFLFLVPGLLLLALLPREDREALALDEALFLAIAGSVALAAWVGLVLAEAGRFSLPAAAGLIALSSLALVLLLRSRLSFPFPRFPGLRPLVPTLAVLVLAVSLQARPSEVVIGGRDPGAYVAAMAMIGRTGGLVYTDPLVLSIPAQDLELFFRHPDNPDFSWGRFMGFPLERPQTGRVFPEFFHLFPAFGAYLFQAAGARGALATPPVFGILGTLGVFFVLRRLFGAAPALLGALLLASNVVQVWFARYPVSETMSQFLIFLGLLAFSHWEERGGRILGALAGAAFGLSLLVRIDSLLIALPVGLYVLVRRARSDLGWRRAAPLLVPIALLALHALLHAALWSRKYVLSITTRPYWTWPAWAWAAFAAAAVLALVLAPRLGARALRAAEGRWEPVKGVVSGLLALLALYAYFVRPLLSAWAGGDGNPRGAALASPGLLLALGFQRLAAHDAQSFLRLGWFVSPLGLILGVLGLLLVFRRWRPSYLLPVLVGLTFALFYFYKIRVWNDYYFALRRFVPVVLPLLLGLAAFFLVELGRRRGARRVAAALLAALLLAAYARDTSRIATHVEWKGAVKFVLDVARRFGPEDVVIFEQRASIHLLSLPLWAVHGVNILELARFNPDPAALQHLIESWRGRHRNVYFVKTWRTDLCGTFLEHVQDYPFVTTEWERTLDRAPRAAEPRALFFSISRVAAPGELVVPPLPEVDVGGTDDVQVSGFFDKEGGKDRTFRWSGPCGSVYLPAAAPGATLTLTASVGMRPLPEPVAARISLNGTPVGAMPLGPEWTESAFTLPDPLPPGPPVLRLDVPAFRPANVVPGSDDTRDLGLMLDRIRVEARPHAKIAVSASRGGAS